MVYSSVIDTYVWPFVRLPERNFNLKLHNTQSHAKETCGQIIFKKEKKRNKPACMVSWKGHYSPHRCTLRLSPYNHATKGAAEHFVQTFKQALMKSSNVHAIMTKLHGDVDHIVDYRIRVCTNKLTTHVFKKIYNLSFEIWKLLRTHKWRMSHQWIGPTQLTYNKSWCSCDPGQCLLRCTQAILPKVIKGSKISGLDGGA